MNIQIRQKCKYLLLMVPLISGALWATPAVTNRDTEVKEAPALTAEQIELIKKDTDLTILERQRGWYRVDTPAENQGWVNMLQLRFKKTPRPNEDAKLLSFIGLRDGTDNITATTGLRGIGRSDIEESEPDFIALEAAFGFKVSREDARKFARQIQLVSTPIPYMKKEKNNAKD